MRPGDDEALLIGFLNTVHLPDGVDALAGSSPAQWLEDGRNDDGRSLHELPEGTPTGSPRRDLKPLLATREGLRALLVRPASAGFELNPARNPIIEADAALRSVPLVLTLDREGNAPTLQPANGSAGGELLAVVATAIIRIQLDGKLTRVKVCARPTCRWAFFDASRNQSRHWCSMASCGNVEKNRAYRARRSTL